MDKITKLSEAIRLGATFRKQCTGHCFDGDKSCAIGAIAEALGYEPNPDAFGKDVVHFIRNRFWEFSPALALEIINRNDGLHHTREQIADWLESQGL